MKQHRNFPVGTKFRYVEYVHPVPGDRWFQAEVLGHEDHDGTFMHKVNEEGMVHLINLAVITNVEVLP